MSKDIGDLITVLKKGKNEEFIFNEDLKLDIRFSDFVSSTISGKLNRSGAIKNKNFLSCKLQNLTFTMEDLSSCDFLDTSVWNSIFDGCELKGAHFNTCFIVDTTFNDCLMEWTNHNKTIFRDCVFINCVFSNILIKNCEFYNCKFYSGTSSNKLFESCKLIDCMFEGIDLQIQTILDNVGLKSDQCKNLCFRSARMRDEHIVYQINEISSYEIEQDADLLKRFSIQYFINGIDLEAYEIIFDIADKVEWLMHHVTSTLISRTQNFIGFILHLYECKSLILLPILKLKDLFSEIVSSVDSRSIPLENKSVYDAFSSLSLTLSRYVDSFLRELNHAVYIQANINEVSLEGYGPVDRDFFSKILSPYVSNGLIEVSEVKPKNSPVEVVLLLKSAMSIWVVLAAVLSTRVKYEVKSDALAFKQLSSGVNEANSKGSITKSGKLKAFRVELGPLSENADDIGFQYLAVFTNGITKKLQIDISPKRAVLIHKHIIGVLKQITISDNAN